MTRSGDSHLDVEYLRLKRIPQLLNLKFALLALATLVVASCTETDGATHETSNRLVKIDVIRVAVAPLVDSVVISGQLDAQRSVALRSEIEGVIESIHFTEGQDVEREEILFTLRDREQKFRVYEANAVRKLARTRLKRAELLVSREASSLSAIDEAKAQVEIAGARADLAHLELERTQIRTPFSGTVGMRLVDIGDRVDSDTKLVQLEATDKLHVTFGVTGEEAASVHPGMIIFAEVKPYPGKRFPGKIYFVSPSLDPRNRRLWVKAEIVNEQHDLRPGLFASVEIELRNIEDAIVVPESAVRVDRKGTYVWMVNEENTVGRLSVETGLRVRGVVEVVDGLREGTLIVTAGAHKLYEGTKVRFSENLPAAPAQKETATEDPDGENS